MAQHVEHDEPAPESICRWVPGSPPPPPCDHEACELSWEAAKRKVRSAKDAWAGDPFRSGEKNTNLRKVFTYQGKTFRKISEAVPEDEKCPSWEDKENLPGWYVKILKENVYGKVRFADNLNGGPPLTREQWARKNAHKLSDDERRAFGIPARRYWARSQGATPPDKEAA